MSEIILAGHVFEQRDLIERALRNLRRSRGSRSKERWVAVMETFAVGSTVAHALCHEFNLDPEEKIK
jgi:hypothetical protein